MKKFDSKSQVVIMCGISGSGKTHFARNLEEQGYLRLSPDALVWQKVGTTIFDFPTSQQRQLFTESRLQIIEQLIELLKSGKRVVVDATHCKRTNRDKIRKVCEETAGIKPVFVYCEADEEELWRRLSHRKGTGPDDLIVTREALSEYCHGFERPQEDETDFYRSE